MEALELLERALREMEAARDALAGAHTMSVLDIVVPSPSAWWSTPSSTRTSLRRASTW